MTAITDQIQGIADRYDLTSIAGLVGYKFEVHTANPCGFCRIGHPCAEIRMAEALKQAEARETALREALGTARRLLAASGPDLSEVWDWMDSTGKLIALTGKQEEKDD